VEKVDEELNNLIKSIFKKEALLNKYGVIVSKRRIGNKKYYPP
jgi:hypothetical protein